ncbi:uncharacterized protein LOC122320715 [Drosophila ficusphila]|uniref:uncharacterized protein LOC122320715 n=1 Tax=Drosophila ficusphila TaxID=30025 RepID=UPI001C8963EE|nr:uncharacterized protein LOC122320715 [Drosophila ficusphila]
MAFIHKLYSGNSSLHNVGLLRLDPDVVYKQNIQPICIEVTPEKEHKESSFKIRKIKPERSNWERFICFFRTFCYPCPSLVTNVPIESEGSPKSILTSSKVSLQTGILSWRNNQTNEIIYTDVMAYAGWILQIAMDVEISSPIRGKDYPISWQVARLRRNHNFQLEMST